MDDLISRQAAIETVEEWFFNLDDNRMPKEVLLEIPSAQPRTKCIAEIKISKEDLDKLVAEKVEEIKAAQPKQRWIPVKTRPMDEEERKEWSEILGYDIEYEDAVIFVSQMPDDGQEILVSYRKWVNWDKCEIDNGCYGLEGNGDWGDVVAWMPLPEPYAERRTDE